MSDLRGFNEWFGDNYKECKNIVLNVTSNHPDSDELLHFVMTMILEKPPKKDVPDNQKKYYFIRLVKNNFHSNTSRYHYLFRKKVYNHRETEFEDKLYTLPEDEVLEDTIPDVEWVRQQLQTYSWFERDIFLLYLEINTIKGVSEHTTIPINSTSKYLNKVKTMLREDWNNRDVC